jgi:DNA-binding NarL/FixJ family response regulator
MLSLIASSILMLATIALAIGAWRHRQIDDKAKRELDGKRAELEALIASARQESQRLEAAIAKAQSLGLAAGRDTLAAIEDLADPVALDDPRALSQVAARIPQLPTGVAEDLFAADEKNLTIVRLLHQGHSAAEIARRLRMPIGEVELLLSLRSA